MKTQIQTSDIRAVLLVDGTWYQVKDESFEIVTLTIDGYSSIAPLGSLPRHKEILEAFTFVQFEPSEEAASGENAGDRISGEMSAIVAFKQKNAATKNVAF